MMAAGLLVAPSTTGEAQAAKKLRPGNQAKLIAQLARHPAVKGDLRVSGRKVKIVTGGRSYPARNLVAVASTVANNYFRVDVKSNRSVHYTGIVRTRGTGLRVVYWGTRWNVEDRLCSKRKPSTAVVVDLGLGPMEGPSCRYDRNPFSLRSKMTQGHVRTLRKLFEPVWDGQGLSSPVTPDFSEIDYSGCRWDGSAAQGGPIGFISKSDPRWGVLFIDCITTSVGGVPGLNSTELLVSRKSQRGNFTRLHAHVLPGWSRSALACASNKRWPVPAKARVDLGFCLPSPAELRDFN
jgi:hypothetical protein